jgi:aminobenzoyl-glutamate transport protein
MPTAAATGPHDVPPARTFYERMLDGIERAGNRVPHPAMIFVGLIVLVIAASQIMHWAGVSSTTAVAKPPAEQVHERQDGGSQYPSSDIPGEQQPPATYQIHQETIKAQGLLTGSGVRLHLHLVHQELPGIRRPDADPGGDDRGWVIGGGVPDRHPGAKTRRRLAISPPATVAFVIVLIGVISSIASDAGYLVLIPLGAAAFMSIGRHPLAGIAARFAVSAPASGSISSSRRRTPCSPRSATMRFTWWIRTGPFTSRTTCGSGSARRSCWHCWAVGDRADRRARLGGYDRAAAGAGVVLAIALLTAIP